MSERPVADLRIGTLALRKRWITPEQLEECLAESARPSLDGGESVPLGAVLLRKGYLSMLHLEALLQPRLDQAMMEPTVVRAEKSASPRPTRSILAPGQSGTPFARYRLIKELGRGGMGVVYQAWDPELKRTVALKMLLSEDAEAEDVERFLREARAVARLRHAEEPAPPTPDPLEGVLWSPIDRRVRELTARRRFGDALAELEGFSPSGPEDRQIVEAARTRILGEAESAYAAIDEHARGLAAEGRHGEAIDAYSPVAEFGLAELAERARKAMAEIESAKVEAGRGAAVEALRGLREGVVSLWLDRRYEEAEARVAAVKDDLSPVAAEAEALGFLVREVRSFEESIRRGAQESSGQEVDTPMGRGEIREAGTSELGVRLTASKVELSVTYASLDPSVAARLARAGGAGPEAIGPHWLFAGRPEEARRVWAQSPRRDDLEALVAIVETVALRREAEEALATLRKSAAKKDWRRCREILALRPRYEATPSWGEAASQIDEIAEQSAEVAEEPLYAVRPRKIGSALEWSYDFTSDTQLRDWRVYPESLWQNPGCPRPTGFGLRLELGPEEALCDGISLGRFRADGSGTWTTDGGVLRAVAGAGQEEYAQLTGPELLDFRARFCYRTEDTRYVEVTLRMGATPVNYYLPVDRPGAWREVEIVAADDAVSCIVDGWLQLRGHAVPLGARAGALRFTVKDGPLSLGVIRVQEIRAVPREGAWTALVEEGAVHGLSLGKSWSVQEAKLIGTGELATSESHTDVEAVLRIEGPVDSGLRLSVRGSQVADWKLPSDGVHVVRLVVKGVTVEVTMDDALVAQGALRDGTGPIGLEVGSKIVTILSFHVRTPR